MTEAQKRRRAVVYSRAFARRNERIMWGAACAALSGVTLAALSAPPTIERITERHTAPVLHVDAQACAKFAALNRDVLGARQPVTGFDLKSDDRGVYNPKDAGIVAARIRAESAERIARDKALTDSTRPLRR